MTNETAIHRLLLVRHRKDCTELLAEALNMAIKALSAQPEKSTTEEKSQLAEEKSTRKWIYLDDAIDAITNTSGIRGDALKALYDLPSAQPERKKGRWIYGEHDIAMCDGYRCDQCGFFVPWDYKHKFIDFIKDYHWCPSCGADMRGEDE